MSLPPERSAEIQKLSHATLAEGRQQQVEAGWSGAVGYFAGLIEQLKRWEIGTHNEVGVNYRMLNDYHKAEDHFVQARQLAQSIGDLDGEVIAVGGLIDLTRTAADNDPTYSRGKDEDLKQATQWVTEAKNILARMPEGDNISKVNTYIQFGLLNHVLNQDEQAVAEYTEAEKQCKALLNSPGNTPEDDAYFKNRFARAAQNKIVAVAALGRVDQGTIANLEETLDTYTELGDVRGQTNCALALARIYRKLGYTQLAKEWYDKGYDFCYTEEKGEKVLADPSQAEYIDNERRALAEQNP